MKLINLTPHTLKISGYGDIEPSGYVARVNTYLSQIDEVEGIPLLVSRSEGLSNLPEPEPNTMFIVASLVRTYVPHRKDVCSPSKLLRNKQGAVIGCSALEVNP